MKAMTIHKRITVRFKIGKVFEKGFFENESRYLGYENDDNLYYMKFLSLIYELG
jgi:hypothetical protein